MKTYPFFVGGKLDGQRVHYDCFEPVMLAFEPENAPVMRVEQRDVIAPIRVEHYRREAAFWDHGQERATVWVAGPAPNETPRNVEMWFRCLP